MAGKSTQKSLGAKQRDALLETLKARFERNAQRSEGLHWAEVRVRLDAHPDKLWSLGELERTGGELDVVGHGDKTGACLFFDCSAESPTGRGASATNAGRWRRGRSTSPGAAPSRRPPRWEPRSKPRKRRPPSWARLIAKVYQSDPLLCTRFSAKAISAMVAAAIGWLPGGTLKARASGSTAAASPLDQRPPLRGGA